ncbi:hypothetical protein Gpo141_00007890 [Globisporangium polare]
MSQACSLYTGVLHTAVSLFFHFAGCLSVCNETTSIELGGIRHYARVEYFNDSGLSVTCNSAIAAELSESVFTIRVDFMDVDKRFPKDAQYRTLREPCIMITATPMRDPHSGQDYVLLRQVAVVRYNLLPNSRLLHEEIRTAQSLSDGDLLIARIFKHFREQHEEGSPSSKQGQHHAALEAARRWRSVIAIVSRKKKNDEPCEATSPEKRGE